MIAMDIDTKKMTNDEFVGFCFNWIYRKNPVQEHSKHYCHALDSGSMTREELLIELLTSDYNRSVLAASESVPHGHFYSALPSGQDRAEFLRNRSYPDKLPAIDVNEKRQLALLEEFKKYYSECPFPEDQSAGFRYYFDNQSFAYTDAIILYSMIRHYQPQRIIEVGSGFSSCVMLDTSEHFLDGRVDITFIEPFPDVLRSLIAEGRKPANILLSSKSCRMSILRCSELLNPATFCLSIPPMCRNFRVMSTG